MREFTFGLAAKFIGEGGTGVESVGVIHLVMVASADAQEFARDSVQVYFRLSLSVVDAAGAIQVEFGVNVDGFVFADV